MIAEFVMFNARILDIDRPNIENASYNLKFRGPRLQCRDYFENRSIPLPQVDWITSRYEESTTDISLFLSTSSMEIMGDIGRFSVRDLNFATDVELNPCPRIFVGTFPGISDEDTVLENDDYSQTAEDSEREQLLIKAETTLTRLSKVTECVAATSEYDVDISFPSGRQVVTYSIGPSETISIPKSAEGIRDVPIWGANYQPLQTMQEYINMVALIDSVGLHFELDCDSYITLIFNMSGDNPSNDKATSSCPARREKGYSCNTGQCANLLSIT
jgi:hypothetical protein